MSKNIDFTEGRILAPLLRFVFPVLFALFLQSLYGAVDLLVVGKFAGAEDVSAVSTGSQIMGTLTNLVSSLAMGVTIFIGEKTGEKDNKAGGLIIGAGMLLFLAIGASLHRVRSAARTAACCSYACSGRSVRSYCDVYQDMRSRDDRDNSI